MTIDDGLELVDRLLRLRREIDGLARSVALTSATFTAEWRAALEAIADRLAVLAAADQQLAPILRPPGGEPLTLEELRAWLVRMAQLDEDGHPAPAPAAVPARLLHPSVH